MKCQLLQNMSCRLIKILLEDSTILATENSFWAWKIWEAIKIGERSYNFNRDARYDPWFSCIREKSEKFCRTQGDLVCSAACISRLAKGDKQARPSLENA